MKERLNYLVKGLPFIDLPYKYYQAAFDYAKENDDDLLKAFSLLNASEHFFRQQFGIAALEGFESKNIMEASKKIYEQNIEYSLTAHDIFIKLKRYKDAYSALINASELKKLFGYLFDTEIGIIGDDELSRRIMSMTHELETKPYESILENAYQNIKSRDNTWSSIKEEDEYRFAKTIAEAYELPDDRIENIIVTI